MKNYLKFWGTRGSCPVSGPEYTHFGGNTCCLEVRYGEHLLILDAGTGIRPLGHTLHAKKIDLFLSHMHWDHIMGLPFFEPLYNKEAHITIWAPDCQGHSCERMIGQVLGKEFFPIHLDQIHSHLTFRTLQEKEPIAIGPLILDVHPTRHPGKTYCFRIKTPHQTIGYVTDNELGTQIPESFIAFHKKSDYFIHEAQYTSTEYLRKEGWGHSSLDHAIALVNHVQPRHWLVTHHDPSHTDADIRAMAQSVRSHPLPCPAIWMPDGHTLHLN
jgi:phosphoribosyl 1,2-cyclic phosphodiesterase